MIPHVPNSLAVRLILGDPSMRIARHIWSLILVFTLVPTSFAGEWKPAAGPLMTRWAKDVTPDKVLPEYPRPQMVRKDWQSLNGLWQLAFAKEGEEPPVGKNLSEQILVPFPVESALSGVMKHSDRLWYRRTFTVPKDWSGQRILLHFGAVDWEATVWVNGKKLGAHRGGYDGFEFDISDALKKEGEQELIVGVYDPTDKSTQPRGKQVLNPESIWYTPTTGIWQTVWLEPVPKTSIE
jgi:beta-galactosidase/beta-glucuronidase